MKHAQVKSAEIRSAVISYLVREEKTYSDLCRQIGWVDTRNKAEVIRIKRTLGINMRDHGKRSKTMNEDTARKLVEVIGMSPVDFGF